MQMGQVSWFSRNLPLFLGTEGSSTTGSSGYSESSSKSARRGSFSNFQIDPELLPEIWTWGANQSGQLGHGDFVMR